jgi:hypothetical protein
MIRMKECKIVHIEKLQEEYDQYDIETKSNHNFFANNILIHNSSMSVYLDPETGLHVCSRNLDLAPDHDHKYNGTAYWRYAIEHDLEDVLKSLGKTIALQGELFGEGIQKNKYGLKGLHYRVFNFWDTINHCYLEYNIMQDAVETFGLGNDFLVPDLGEIVLNHNVDDLLQIFGKGTYAKDPLFYRKVKIVCILLIGIAISYWFYIKEANFSGSCCFKIII